MSYNVQTTHKEILDQIDSSYQKTVGFPTYDITRAVALAVVELGGDLDTAWAGVDVDNIKGADLTKWCWQRKGVARKEAVKATGEITVVAGSGTITVGDLCESAGGIQFVATESKVVVVGDTVTIEAVTGGGAGNVVIGGITGMPVTIPGIATITNATATDGGFDAENDTALRERYYDALRKPMTAGNKNQYEAWAKEVPGVGDAKIYPLERGANTVDVVIVDSDMTVADATLVAAVQAYIDPGNAGTGEGVAPMGAHCYVVSATETVINVEVTVTKLPSYALAEIETAIDAAIRAYFKSIAFSQDYVSYGKIGNAVNDAIGVQDYSLLTINAGTANIPVPDKFVPALGVLTVHD